MTDKARTKSPKRPFEDHFSHMESALFRQMTQERQDEAEIDALLDQLFPGA